MKYQTVKNCGELGIEFLNDDDNGARVSRDFLDNLIKKIVKRSTNYYDDIGEHIFI